jgi:hypothetical protein
LASALRIVVTEILETHNKSGLRNLDLLSFGNGVFPPIKIDSAQIALLRG